MLRVNNLFRRGKLSKLSKMKNQLMITGQQKTMYQQMTLFDKIECKTAK